MSFLSAYSDVKRVPIGDPERGYWVDLKEYVSQGDKEDAERALTAMVVNDGKAVVNPDVTTYRQLTLVAAIAGWNLDDNGVVWPVSLESVKRLPGVVFDELWKHVEESNAPRSKEDQLQFRAGDVSGDPHGDTGA